MSKNKKTANVADFIPAAGKQNALYSADEMIERVGQEAIKEVVISVLCGGNIRSLTEGLTKRRLTLSNASLFFTYLQAAKNIKNFVNKMPEIVSNELKNTKLNAEEKLYLEWMLGLTKKGIQNILRNEDIATKNYLTDLEESFAEAAQQIKSIFGDLKGELNIGSDSFWIDWLSLLQIFTAIGTQTLAIRGAEKSMYGKLFEKLILASFLTILGFEKIEQNDVSKMNKVFWLSSRENKRESDATLLYKPGIGVRFDIGFIGPGNSEISLDKVSRFEREMDFGRQKHFMSTIIIVDRIGKNSRIIDMAKNIEGHIVQMSMSQWVREVCSILKEKIEFTHPLLDMNDDDSLMFIKRAVMNLDIKKFVEKED
ncbi:MAG: CfrBI family restriction endonuclease [Microscillaceae bacterium]|nr:CfrBI family restriction endonuclease [Microscillaceae bacterium]